MNNKDTIYIDIDDEITSIIDKVRGSEQRLVALVLPKRATVLQSFVNMKLLKRTADDAKKQVVLITSEAGLLPLAGSVGMYVASTLQSKPAIPTTEAIDDAIEDIDEEAITLEDDFDPKAAAAVPVGALAAKPTDELAATVTEEPETIDLADDTEEAIPTAVPAEKAATKPKAAKPNKKLAVPNFTRFRKRLIFGALALILLIAVGYVCLSVLPKAAITVVTDTSTINTNEPITLSVPQKTLDTADSIVPAEVQQTQKTTSQQVPASGQKNNGTTTSGTVVFYDCDISDLVTGTSQTLPAGTGISYNGLTYITQTSVTIQPSTYTKDAKTCKSDHPSSSVAVKAQSAGSKYNIDASSPVSFAVNASNPSDGSNSFSATSANGFSDGSDSNVKIVTQADLDSAKQKLSTADPSTIKQQLEQQLQNDGYQVIDATFTAGTPSITSSANAGDQADTVTVTQATTYSVFGAKKADLQALITANVNKQIDTSKQQIQDDGLSGASYKVASGPTSNSVQLTFQASSTAGPKLDVTALKTQLAGRKSGDVQSYLKQTPGVQNVTVKFSPFWVDTVPNHASKVTVNLVKASGGSNGQ